MTTLIAIAFVVGIVVGYIVNEHGLKNVWAWIVGAVGVAAATASEWWQTVAGWFGG